MPVEYVEGVNHHDGRGVVLYGRKQAPVRRQTARQGFGPTPLPSENWRGKQALVLGAH
jgi:hypothetical protein